MWLEVFDIFQKYMGTGLVMIWFFAALIYLFIAEKNKERRVFFVYMPTVLLLLYFNPLFAGIFFELVGSEIYFRICWMLPIIIVIAYAAVCIIEQASGVKQILYSILALILIAASGKLVYTNPLYSVAENIYHVPQAVVELCDAMHVPGREIKVAAPPEFILYMRQYDATICMPYGRGNLEEEAGGFYDAMGAEVYDIELLDQYADATYCHYVILQEQKEILGDPQDYGWEIFDCVAGYVIYHNIDFPLARPAE